MRYMVYNIYLSHYYFYSETSNLFLQIKNTSSFFFAMHIFVEKFDFRIVPTKSKAVKGSTLPIK